MIFEGLPNFIPTEYGLKKFTEKYTLSEGETLNEAIERVAFTLASVEKPEKIKMYVDEFSAVMSKGLLWPGGRIWYGAGRPKGMLGNCFHLKIRDSMDGSFGWSESIKNIMDISSYGGGVGFTLSAIRPKGSPINGKGGYTSGAVSPARIADASCKEIQTGGGRRSALLASLAINHPDVYELISSKLDKNQLNMMNISVEFNEDLSPEMLFELIDANQFMDLMWHEESYRKVKPSKLWEEILRNILKSGEPGLLNLALANEMNNVFYDAKITGVNPCGELPLSEGSSCFLASLNLPLFYINNEFQWELFSETVYLGVRMLDNAIDASFYPLDFIEEETKKYRRAGLGTTGLHDLLLMMGIKYGSKDSLTFIDKLFKFKRDEEYSASILISAEKGSFPKFNAEKLFDGGDYGFVKTLKRSIQNRIKQYGLRNAAIATNAPVGTGSLILGVSSGIEAFFAPAYIRNDRNVTSGDEVQSSLVVQPIFQKMIDKKLSLEHFQGCYEISLEEHLKVQATCQKYIDGAISKTVSIISEEYKDVGTNQDIIKNCNTKVTTIEDLDMMLRKFMPYLKGTTIYPNESRANQPYIPLSVTEAIEAVKGKKLSVEAKTIECPSGTCDL